MILSYLEKKVGEHSIGGPVPRDDIGEDRIWARECQRRRQHPRVQPRALLKHRPVRPTRMRRPGQRDRLHQRNPGRSKRHRDLSELERHSTRLVHDHQPDCQPRVRPPERQPWLVPERSHQVLGGMHQRRPPCGKRVRRLPPRARRS